MIALAKTDRGVWMQMSEQHLYLIQAMANQHVEKLMRLLFLYSKEPMNDKKFTDAIESELNLVKEISETIQENKKIWASQEN